ncbi:uncharacterized protein J3R85_001404 [Psidium guajava]|nr:uncharacterized protein J3R85_001404 [Psidium guajava]
MCLSTRVRTTCVISNEHQSSALSHVASLYAIAGRPTPAKATLALSGKTIRTKKRILNDCGVLSQSLSCEYGVRALEDVVVYWDCDGHVVWRLVSDPARAIARIALVSVGRERPSRESGGGLGGRGTKGQKKKKQKNEGTVVLADVGVKALEAAMEG